MGGLASVTVNSWCRFGSFCLALGLSGYSHGVDYYLSGLVDYAQIRIAREQFVTPLARFKLGGVMAEGFTKGVGLEVVVGVPLADDENKSVTTEVNEHYGVYLTFADYRYKGLRLGVSLGFSSSDIDTTLSVNGNKAGDAFSSGSFGLSLQNSIAGSAHVNWVVDCLQYFKVEEVKMSGCGLGVKYDF